MFLLGINNHYLQQMKEAFDTSWLVLLLYNKVIKCLTF
jgi:hypothetical protein